MALRRLAEAWLAPVMLREEGQSCGGELAGGARARAPCRAAGSPVRRDNWRRFADAPPVQRDPVPPVHCPTAPKAARAVGPNRVPDTPTWSLPSVLCKQRVVSRFPGPSLLLNGSCAAKVPHAVAGSRATAPGPAQSAILRFPVRRRWRWRSPRKKAPECRSR